MKLFLDNITKYFQRQNDPEFVRAVDRNFTRVADATNNLRTFSRNFVDATAAPANYQLPSGYERDEDFFVVKTDASANAVTVVPFGTETIAAGATLGTQYDSVLLTFSAGVWYPVSYP